MYFTWNQDLLNLTDYPCSRSDGVRFEVTSYADKTLSNPNTRLTSTFGIRYLFSPLLFSLFLFLLCFFVRY